MAKFPKQSKYLLCSITVYLRVLYININVCEYTCAYVPNLYVVTLTRIRCTYV